MLLFRCIQRTLATMGCGPHRRRPHSTISSTRYHWSGQLNHRAHVYHVYPLKYCLWNESQNLVDPSITYRHRAISDNIQWNAQGVAFMLNVDVALFIDIQVFGPTCWYSITLTVLTFRFRSGRRRGWELVRLWHLRGGSYCNCCGGFCCKQWGRYNVFLV